MTQPCLFLWSFLLFLSSPIFRFCAIVLLKWFSPPIKLPLITQFFLLGKPFLPFFIYLVLLSLTLSIFVPRKISPGVSGLHMESSSAVGSRSAQHHMHNVEMIYLYVFLSLQTTSSSGTGLSVIHFCKSSHSCSICSKNSEICIFLCRSKLNLIKDSKYYHPTGSPDLFTG